MPPAVEVQSLNPQTARKLPMCVCAELLSRVQLLCDPMTVAQQAPLFMGFSRQEYQSRLPFPTPGDLPDPGIEPESLELPGLAGVFFTTAPIHS